MGFLRALRRRALATVEPADWVRLKARGLETLEQAARVEVDRDEVGQVVGLAYFDVLDRPCGGFWGTADEVWNFVSEMLEWPELEGSEFQFHLQKVAAELEGSR